LIVVALVLAAVAAQGAVLAADPTAESVAVASLLQAGDLFAGSTTSGVTVGPADDLPAFAANGGLREARQTWTSTDPIALIFDFRFQFPDEASAVAFLDASETDLAETANGLVLTPLLDPPLPDTRFYAADLGTYGSDFNWLMHEGNLVAKVFVGGSGNVSQTTASQIAQTAAARMTAALTGATASAGPTAGSSAGASMPPSASPAASPVETPLPTPDPAAVLSLLAAVPPAMAPTCAGVEFTADQPPRGGELARVGCLASNGAGISLSAFDSTATLGDAFSAGELVAQLFGQLSATGTCQAGGYDGSWTIDGAPAGSLLCYSLEGAAVIDWSDPQHLLLGSVRQAVGDSGAAYQAWLEAGSGARAPAN
jgi:hypothetical protein